MQNNLIPGLDVLHIAESSNACDTHSQTEINLSIFGDKFKIPDSLSNGNCRSLKEFKISGRIRHGVPEAIYQCYDIMKKRPVTLVKYNNLKPLDEELKFLLCELEVVRSLKYDHILQFYETAVSPVFLVYEPYACFLSDLIEKEVKQLYQLPVIKNVMFQLFEALNYIHEHSIMHRNIHPQNISISESGCLKVWNFRNARYLWDQDTSIQTTEFRYQSPELLMGTKICSTSVDIWSAACVLVELLVKKSLFQTNDPRRTLSDIFAIFGFPTKECWPEFFDLPEFVYFHCEKNSHSYNFLNIHLKELGYPQNQNTMDLLQSMFCLNPKDRFKAYQCSSHFFFAEEPLACKREELVHCVDFVVRELSRTCVKVERKS